MRHGTLSRHIDGDLGSIFCVRDASEAFLDSPPRLWHRTKHNRVIDFFYAMILELSEEMLERRFAQSNHHTTARITINTMHKRWLECETIIFFSQKILDLFDERCLIRLMISRMHIDAGRLVHDKNILIAQEHLKRWFPRGKSRLFAMLKSRNILIGEIERELISELHTICLLGALAVYLNLAGAKHLVDTAQGCGREEFFQELVETLVGVGCMGDRNQSHAEMILLKHRKVKSSIRRNLANVYLALTNVPHRIPLGLKSHVLVGDSFIKNELIFKKGEHTTGVLISARYHINRADH